MTTLFNLFYVSQSSTFEASVVTSIADQSQVNNKRDSITGLLLFDGKFWCQYVEGAEAAVQDLLERLQRDTRHHDMRVLQRGSVGGARKFPDWRMGFSYVADQEAIQRVLRADSGQAFESFNGIDRAVEGSNYGAEPK